MNMLDDDDDAEFQIRRAITALRDYLNEDQPALTAAFNLGVDMTIIGGEPSLLVSPRTLVDIVAHDYPEAFSDDERSQIKALIVSLWPEIDPT